MRYTDPTPRGAAASDIPLCVDLDGTLVNTDTLHECIVLLITQNPWAIFLLPIWLLQGKTILKRRVAERVRFDPAFLPYNAEFLSFLNEQRLSGRKLILVTAADRLIAEPISRHLGLFDEVLATDPGTNLKGAAKSDLLQQRFRSGFDYAGNSPADLHAWQHSRYAIVVNASNGLAKETGARANVSKTFGGASITLRDCRRMLRVHQWAKNLLIVVPVVTAHRFLEWRIVSRALLAVVVFSFCASAVYIINDLVDLDADRRHPVKRKRPFASGTIPIAVGIILFPLLLLASAVLVRFLPAPTAWILPVYFVGALCYSFRLKRTLLIDVFTLSGLYTLRILAGDAATGIPLSPWLFSFSGFIFLSLAFNKRVSELRHLHAANQHVAHGRGYRSGDVEQLNTYGVVAGFMACLVLVLYINSDNVHKLYAQPQLLWLLCPMLLYWLARVWLITARGEMNGDPVSFAIRDKTTYYIIAVSALILLFATKSWIPGLDGVISQQ